MEEMPSNDGTDASVKLTKDKIHVEELRLPEIMIPMIKTKGNDRNILCITGNFFGLYLLSSRM